MVLYEGWKASGVISIQIRGPKNWGAQHLSSTRSMRMPMPYLFSFFMATIKDFTEFNLTILELVEYYLMHDKQAVVLTLFHNY